MISFILQMPGDIDPSDQYKPISEYYICRKPFYSLDLVKEGSSVR